MTAAVTTQPEKRPWRRLVFATAAMIILPLFPQLRLVFPIEQTMLLVIPAVAACALAGWRNGERAGFAIIWTVVAVWMLAQSAGAAGSSYDFMARGWALLLAACFGLSAVLTMGGPFFGRALASLGVAALIAFGAAAGGPGGVQRVNDLAKAEFGRRSAESISDMNRNLETKEWKEITANSPVMAEAVVMGEVQLRTIPKYSLPLLGALIGLESLAALALAWAFYHRFATNPIGPELGQLRDFRFNDQLIWGLAVGATIFLLPPFAEGRGAGLNLLVFFGTLYALRGIGILKWMSKGRSFGITVGLVIFLGLIYPPTWLFVGLLALGLGLGDTWLDWRKRAQNI